MHGLACEEKEEEAACEEAAWVYWKMASSQFCHIYYAYVYVHVCVCVCVRVYITCIDIWKMASSQVCQIYAMHLGGTSVNPATISNADNARKVDNFVLSFCEKKKITPTMLARVV